MHFWIDKRSQTCGFSGRHRVPSSLSARGGGGRRWTGGVKPMVTPVHRFHQVECLHQPRRNLPAYNGEGCSEGRVEVDSSVFLEAGVPLALHQQEPVVGKLRCGVWASFALAIVFVAGAKFYVINQGTGLEVLVACMGVVVLLYVVAWYTVSRCRAKSSHGAGGAVPGGLETVPSHPHPHHHTAAPLPPPPPPPLLDEAPPPPYHIAVDLPHSVTPPPSYDKAVS